MWIILRLCFAAAIGLLRFNSRQVRPEETRRTDGLDWVLRRVRNKQRVISTSFGMPFAHPLYLRFSREGWFDRMAKSAGFAHEIQTDDTAFDRATYIACDHPALGQVLRHDAEARQAITALFAAGATGIDADGNHLWVRRKGDTPPEADQLRQLGRLQSALAVVPAHTWAAQRDPFFWRAFIISCVAWSLAFYGLPAFFELKFAQIPLYFDYLAVIQAGLVTAGVILALALTAVWYLVRGSSRAHRIFTESALVFGLGIPFSSIAIFSDLNTTLDLAPAEVLSLSVQQAYTSTHTRKGRQYTKYHLQLSAPANGRIPAPGAIEVPADLYVAARAQGGVVLTLRRGALGLPWIESLRARWISQTPR